MENVLENLDNNNKNLNIEDHSDRKVMTGNLAKNSNVQDQSEVKISRFRNLKKENKALSEKENNEIENKQILERFHNDIFTKTTSKIITSVNKYSEDVTSEEIKEDVLKFVNNNETTKEQKNNLYFKLKAGKIIFNFLEKYNNEIENQTRIPDKFNDLLDISEEAKVKYNFYKNRLKLIDIFLCMTSITSILLAFYDVNNFLIKRIIDL